MMYLFQASLVLLSLFAVILAQNDEFYCERKADQWQVCRTCNNSTQGNLLRGTAIWSGVAQSVELFSNNFCLCVMHSGYIRIM